jgi:hypothetical protein
MKRLVSHPSLPTFEEVVEWLFLMNPELLLFIFRLLIALLLYLFLVLILRQLWQDLQAGKRITSHAPKAHLLTIKGEGIQETYPLQEINLIGRAQDNTLCIDETTVSGYHARLSYQQGQWWLEDLGSRNGTLLNDLPVTEPIVVAYSDEIHFGNVCFRFVAGPTPEITETLSVTREPDQK